jgi:hypothetical protein
MNKSLFKQPLFYTTVLSLSLLGLIIASYVFGWTTPTASPPAGNVVLSQGALPAGSPGYVQFASSSTAFGADAGLFWDNTNKRLGIGTTAPGEKLEVVGGNLKVGGSIKDSAGNIIYDDSTKKIPSARLPFDQGDITSDWASSSWTSGYYDVTNLTPANVKSGVTFGRGQTGTGPSCNPTWHNICSGGSYIYPACNNCQTAGWACANYGGSASADGTIIFKDSYSSYSINRIPSNYLLCSWNGELYFSTAPTSACGSNYTSAVLDDGCSYSPMVLCCS